MSPSSACFLPRKLGGDERVRTAGLLLARQALYQLSYTPTFLRFGAWLVLPLRFSFLKVLKLSASGTFKTVQYLPNSFLWTIFVLLGLHLRKEVIQPHLPIRLPCYDFTPVIDLTLDNVLLAVRLLASGALNSHGVTGGVYKARERIHRGMLIRDY